MEQNVPDFAKKVWKLVRVLYFMLHKGISKTKLLMNLNKMMKRGKIAGKSLHNLLFHINHHHNHHNWPGSPPPGEHEFCCTNSPIFSLFTNHKKHHSTKKQPNEDDHDDIMAVNDAVIIRASPALPGFGGSSAMVRQLRVTDSPFPMSSVEEDSHVVDEAAEKFISRFYNDLRRQNTKGY